MAPKSSSNVDFWLYLLFWLIGVLLLLSHYLLQKASPNIFCVCQWQGDKAIGCKKLAICFSLALQTGLQKNKRDLASIWVELSSSLVTTCPVIHNLQYLHVKLLLHFQPGILNFCVNTIQPSSSITVLFKSKYEHKFKA